MTRNNDIYQLAEDLVQKLKRFGVFEDEEQNILDTLFLQIELDNELLTKQKSDYLVYLDNFNQITGKKYQPDTSSRELYYQTQFKYSLREKITALQNAITDSWKSQDGTLVEFKNVIKPNSALKPDNIAKYLNFAPSKTITSTTLNTNNQDYGNVEI